jgi:hypothetical protein
MSSASDKIREKVLLESIINRDVDSFHLLFSEIVEEQYNNLIKSRVCNLEGLI